MKVKLIAVLAIVAALFIGAVLWRTDSFVYGDRLSWVDAQTRTQLGAINYSLITELKSLQRVVATFDAENFQRGKLNWAALKPYYAAASFAASNSGNEVHLEPQVLLTKENSKAAPWNKEFIKSAIGSIAKRTSDLKFFIKPFQDSQQGRYVALLFLEGNRAYALFGSGEIFQSLIDSQRGALSSFSIVTETGLTVGHSVPEYLGTVMRDDPVFKEAQQGEASHGSSTFNLKSGELFGMFERIPQSNLIVLSSASLKETMKGRSGLWWQFLLLGCGLLAVGIAAVLTVIMPTERRIEKMEKQLQTVKAKPASIPVPEKIVKSDPETIHKEKMEASMRVASALGHEMSGPLASILGYSQMILAKAPEVEIVQSTDSIIRETRAARGILDKLLSYAGEEVKEKNTMKVEGPLVKALKALDSVFTNKGVKLVKNFQDTSVLDLHVDAVIRALTNILQNSVEAMERMAKKEIKVDLFEDAEGVHLTIEDTGEGIETKSLENIFDPFFTTRSFQNHMGLGLSVALGILKEHNAEIKVESQRGQGTKVMILFKKNQSAPVLKPPVEIEQEEYTVSAELPKLKEGTVQREEAEKQFVEQQTLEQEIIVSSSTSPLDVNIENLLELPEIGEQQLEQAEKERTVIAAEGTPQPQSQPQPQPQPQAQPQPIPNAVSFGEDELTFIDGFLEQEVKTVVNSMGPVAALPTGPTAEELAVMDNSLSTVNKINPPKSAAKPKTSKLDTYHVEIRRPGKRI